MFLQAVRQFIEDHAPWGIPEGVVANQLTRDTFSRFFPWRAYDPESEMYLLADEGPGFIWECAPLSFAGLSTLQRLESLIQQNLPAGSIIQFHLLADDYLDLFLESIRRLRTREDPLLETSTHHLLSFLKNATRGDPKVNHIPLRNFRLFVSFRLPPEVFDSEDKNLISNSRQTVKEVLQTADLFPKPMPPERLLAWLRWLFNKTNEPAALYNYDPDVPIHKQILCAEQVVEDCDDVLKIGDRYFACTTPKTFPVSVNPLQTHELTGGIWGLPQDHMQIPGPFLYTYTIIFSQESLKASLHAKCNFMLQQKGVGSFAPSLARRQEELLRTVDQLDRGVPFVQVIPTVWVWSDSRDQLTETLVRIRSLWEPHGYVMQNDKRILKILLLISLPLGFTNEKNFIELLDRHFIMHAPAVARILPVQADFAGGGNPVLVFFGRKGQFVTLDLFSKAAGTNYNAMILAGSGSGKSFLTNYIVNSYYATGAKIRLIDIGGSYKKLTKMLGARFMEFSPTDIICLNPFTHLRNDDGPQDEVGAFLNPVCAVISQMCFASVANPTVTQLQATLIRKAVEYAWRTKQNAANIDDVYDYLASFPAKADEKMKPLADKKHIVNEAHLLAIYLQPFLSDGVYGKYFNGPSDFDISSDDIAVLELDYLRNQPDLFRVVTLQVVNAVTADLYLAKDRSTRRFIILDEAWQFLDSGGDAQQLAAVIESGYRRARKYGGSFSVISQSLLDLRQFGAIGDVIYANSAYKFYLQSKDFTEAKKRGIIDYDEFTMQLLNSTLAKKGSYSEIFMDTPFGRGHARFVVDDFNYYVYTTDPEEVTEIETMVEQEGLSYHEAIERMVAKYRAPKT